MDASLIFFRIRAYLKYIVCSKNRKGHGIHSPFVFDLVNRVFRNRNDLFGLAEIRSIRKSLKKETRRIEVNDPGAGSVIYPGRIRSVSEIVRASAVPEKYGILLSNMAREFGNPLIIELGTSLGISTLYMAHNCCGASIFTMEGDPSAASIASGIFSEAGLQNIRLYKGSFEKGLEEIATSEITPGLIFIDGDHRKQSLLQNFDTIAEIADHNSVVIIDDINYSREMNEAWHLIQAHEKVTVSIDLFRMGILFFRRGITRNSLMIRY